VGRTQPQQLVGLEAARSTAKAVADALHKAGLDRGLAGVDAVCRGRAGCRGAVGAGLGQGNYSESQPWRKPSAQGQA
jgi:ferredoxin